MHAQSQSPFFAILPPEVRAQIQIEYLAEYLRQAPVHREHGRPCFLYSVSSAPISSLSLSCKRMFKDMRHSQEPVGVGRRFALFLATSGARSVVVSEGKDPEWRLVRHVRFINEMDHLCTDVWESYHLTRNFLRTLREATQLAELELEWNPRMSILLGDGYVTDAQMLRDMMEGIRGSPALRRLRLRGPFPRTWTNPGPDALPGLETIVEPVIMWPEREEEDEEDEEFIVEEDEEEVRRKKAHSIADQKARLAAQVELRAQADKIRGDSSRWQRFQRKLDAWKGKR